MVRFIYLLRWTKNIHSSKYDWIWQFVFPSGSISQDPRSGEVRRYHLHESSLQKALKQAVHQAGIQKKVVCHTFRHSFYHLLQNGYDIPIVKELLEHKDDDDLYSHLEPLAVDVSAVHSIRNRRSRLSI